MQSQQQDLFLTIKREDFYQFPIEEAAVFMPRCRVGAKQTFNDFCREKGFPNIEHEMLNGVCAEMFFGCTRQNSAEYNKRQRGRKARAEYEFLIEEYDKAIKSGAIETWSVSVPLDLSKEADLARARMGMRRSCQRAQRKGLSIPSFNKQYL